MQLTDIVVRPALSSDWPGIAALLGSNELPLAGVEKHLGSFVVAYQGDGLTGVAGLELYEDIALLRSVAVVQRRHNRGVGRALMRAILDVATRHAVRDVFLLTTTAPDYFGRFGFVRLAREAAPLALKMSAEFQGACPASAVLMHTRLVKSC